MSTPISQIDSMDTTARTLAAAKRMPQWQRLITTVHKAQEAGGFNGRQFGEAEMAYFGATLIGTPVERVNRGNKEEFAAYWIERQSTTHSDGETYVRYVVKTVQGDNLAYVYSLGESELVREPTWNSDRLVKQAVASLKQSVITYEAERR